MDLATYLRFVLALVAVLALIWLLAWLARRYGLGGALGAGGRSGGRRLAIVEVLAVDAKHRLVLVRRDGVEHLILTGASGDIVVERGIAPPAIVQTPASGVPRA